MLWKMVATVLLLTMASRLRPERSTALIGIGDGDLTPIASPLPTPLSIRTSTEGDTMSRNHPFHPVPRGGIDPIRCRDDALAVLALGAPYGDDTIVIPLDTERRGCSVMVVTDTVGSDAMFRVLATCVAATRDHPEIDGLILATSRPGGAVENDDVHRWLEASDQCAAGGLELIEWFVIGKWGPDCPRELFGEPERWVA